MKKIGLILLSIILSFGLVACADAETTTTENKDNVKVEESSKEDNKEEVKNYIKETSTKGLTIGDAWGKVSEATQKGVEYIYSQDGTIDLATQFTIIKQSFEEIEEIQAPDECKEIHGKWMQVKEEQLKAVNLYMKGIDNKDPNSLNDGSKILENSNSITNEIAKMNEEIIKD